MRRVFHEPVIFGSSLSQLTQLDIVTLNLTDFSGLEHLPPHVSSLNLSAWEHLDMTVAPWLLRCSSLQSLVLQTSKGEHSHALAQCA